MLLSDRAIRWDTRKRTNVHVSEHANLHHMLCFFAALYCCLSVVAVKSVGNSRIDTTLNDIYLYRYYIHAVIYTLSCAVIYTHFVSS